MPMARMASEAMDVPIAEGEVIEETCRVPAGSETRPRNLLLSRFGLEVPAPEKISIAGFMASWGLVALIIAAFFLISRG